MLIILKYILWCFLIHNGLCHELPPPSYKPRPMKKATANKANTIASKAKGLPPTPFSPTISSFIPMPDCPSTGLDVSHLDYYEAVKYNNAIALNSTDGSTHPFGIEHWKTANVIVKNCHGNEDTVTKGTVLIPCSSLETAETVFGSA